METAQSMQLERCLATLHCPRRIGLANHTHTRRFLFFLLPSQLDGVILSDPEGALRLFRICSIGTRVTSLMTVAETLSIESRC